MRVETCVYGTLSPIHTHSRLIIQWYTAASPGTAPVLHSRFHVISRASTFSSRCAASTSISGLSGLQWAASAAALTSCASESHTFSPTYSGGKRLCFLMMKDGLVTMNTSAFSTLLLQRLVFGSVLTYTEKSPDCEWWAFRPRSWFCNNQSERRLQCGA